MTGRAGQARTAGTRKPAARKAAATRRPARPEPQVRFVRQYTSWNGNVFQRFAASDGQVAGVQVRHGRKGPVEYTNAEAEEVAAWRLTARPGSVRFVRAYVNDFTGLIWHICEGTDGRQQSVCTRARGFLGGRTLTRAQTRAEAVRRLGAGR